MAFMILESISAETLKLTLVFSQTNSMFAVLEVMSVTLMAKVSTLSLSALGFTTKRSNSFSFLYSATSPPKVRSL